LPDTEEQNTNIFLENIERLEEVVRKKARKIVIKINYDMLTDAFNRELKEKIAQNRDSVPYLIVVNRADGKRALIDSIEGDGLKATVSMKNDIETLTGENTVEILF